MFGHKWEPAHGTITGVEPDPRQHHELVYLVDVPLDSRGGLRARVAPTRSMSPDLPPGTQVRVEVNAKTGDVRFAADPVEGLSPGQIEAPAGADWRDGADWPQAGAPGGVNVTVNVTQDGASALGDVAEILRRLGGEAAGGAVAAALANLGSGPTDSPAQPGTPQAPGTAEIRVTSSDPQIRVVGGAEAAEFMREFFGGSPPAGERPTDEG